MQDRPSGAELLEAIREWIEREAAPALGGRAGYHARVVANALAILEREALLGPGFDAAERERLRSLLGRDGTLEDLNRELARRIRDGSLDDRMDSVVAHVRRTVRNKLEIANPRWLEGTAR